MNASQDSKQDSRQARFIVRHAFAILGAIILLTAVFLPAAAGLKLKANFLGLLPEHQPSAQSLNKLLSRVGSTSYVIVAIESADEESARLAAERLTKDAAALKNVEAVDNRTNIPEFAHRRLLFLDLDSVKRLEKNIQDVLAHYRRQNNPFSLGLLDEAPPKIDLEALKLEQKVYGIGAFSRKEAGSFMRVVLIKPSFRVGDFDPSQELFSAIEERLTRIAPELPQPITFGITGPYKTRHEEYATIQSDLKLTTMATVGLIVVILIAGFRNARSIVLSLVPLTVGTVWMCAFAAWSIGYLNLISAFLIGIMTGMGIDYCLHMLVDLEAERKVSRDSAEAVERTIRSIGMPLVTSSLTTVIAFFSLCISNFEGYRHFGLIAGVGLLLYLAVIFYGLPSMIVAGERLGIFRWKPSEPRFHVAEPQAGPVRIMVAAGVLLTLAALFYVPRVKFEYSFAELQSRDSQGVELAMRIGDHFGVVLNPVAVLTPNRQRAAEIAEQINRHAAQTPGTKIDFAASLMTQVPLRQAEKIEVLKRIEQFFVRYERLIQTLSPEVRRNIEELRQQLSAEPFGVRDLPQSLHEQYEGKTREFSVVFVYPNASIMDGRVGKAFVKELRSLNLPDDAELAGEPMIYVDILNMLERDTPIALGISLAVIILLLFFHFRSPADVLWVLAPVLTGMVWMLGAAGFLGVKFNYMNMAILPTVLGVGIDSGVYIFHRYKKENKSTMAQILDKTGKAVILSSATTMAAFASLFLAHHRGMSSMGAIGFLGFGACLLTSVVFVPALMEFIALKRWNLFGHAKKF